MWEWRVSHSYPMPLIQKADYFGQVQIFFLFMYPVASQADGYIYVFEVPLKTQPNSTVAYSGGSWQPASGLDSLQALYYHQEEGHVYAVANRWLLQIDATTRQ